MRDCECGCGEEIARGTYRRGHHQRGPGGFHRLPPEEKTCDRCGKTYHRSDLISPQSNKYWAARRYCSDECRTAALAEICRAVVGPAHPSYKGSDGTRQAGRKRGRKIHAEIGPCEICGDPRSERHHVNGDTHDNRPENIQILCRAHHIQVEDRMAYRRKPMTPERLAHKRALAAARARRYRARKNAAR